MYFDQTEMIYEMPSSEQEPLDNTKQVWYLHKYQISQEYGSPEEGG